MQREIAWRIWCEIMTDELRVCLQLFVHAFVESCGIQRLPRRLVKRERDREREREIERERDIDREVYLQSNI